MKRTFVLLVALLVAAALPASGQTPDKTTLLLQRLVMQYGGGQAEVFVGKLPADMPKVPLPDVTVLGSIHRKIDTAGEGDTTDSYEVLYDATADAMNAYRAALSAAGWANKHTPFDGGAGGFVPSRGPSSSVYCKASAPMISIWTGADPTDITVTVAQTAKMADLVCGGPEAMAKLMTAQMQRVMAAALPELHAPAGTTMRLGRSGIQTGQSGAYISGASSAQKLLDNFSAQMRAAGWQPGASSTDTALASQTFHFVDTNKTPWQCVITVYAVDGKPGDFIGFIDATNLSTVGKP